MKNLLSNLEGKRKETIKRYNEIAKEYDGDWRGGHDKVQLEHLNKFEKIIGSPPKKILDAGCGNGKDSVFFASDGYEVYGIDLSEKMLERAVEKAKSKDVNVKLFLQDMRCLDFSDRYFDGVWTTATFVHLSPGEKKETIQEFYRILKPGGFLHIWVQNLLAIKHVIRLFQSYFGFTKDSKFNFINKVASLSERIKNGYAFIDNRHWFYPAKHSLLKVLKEENFSISETNHLFSRRLSIYARKT